MAAVIVYGILEPVFYGIEDGKYLTSALEALNKIIDKKWTKKTIFGNQFYLIFEHFSSDNCNQCAVAKKESCPCHSGLFDCVCLQCDAIRMHILSNTEYRVMPTLIVNEVHSVSDNQPLFNLIIQSRLGYGTRIECMKRPQNTSLIRSSLILSKRRPKKQVQRQH